mgnify:CR=1 FL=1
MLPVPWICRWVLWTEGEVSSWESWLDLLLVLSCKFPPSCLGFSNPRIIQGGKDPCCYFEALALFLTQSPDDVNTSQHAAIHWSRIIHYWSCRNSPSIQTVIVSYLLDILMPLCCCLSSLVLIRIVCHPTFSPCVTTYHGVLCTWRVSTSQ